MGDRLQLQAELETFGIIRTSVYFQPPSGKQMVYPCIVYNKTGKERTFANNGIYKSLQEYRIVVIDHDPDSTVADSIERRFQYCVIDQYYTVDNLNHTALTLYY
jgi:hypothetical protein